MDATVNTTCNQQPNSTAQTRSLDDVVAQTIDVSTLPQVATKVIEVASDARTGARDLREIIEGDPALSGRVLRTVNSAAYALNSKITNLHQAISFLGFAQIRNLALTASVAHIFRKPIDIGPYRRHMLWRHMVTVGMCARLVAMRLKLADYEDCFLAGLLHDIGIILEDQNLHPHFCRVIADLKENTTLIETERRHLGFDHAVLGARIAEKWHFPPMIRAAVRYHHHSHNYNGVGADMVRCVEVANIICTLKGISSVGMALIKPNPQAFSLLNLQKEDIVILAEDLDREISVNKSLFEL